MVILDRNAVEGMKASPGDVLFRLADVWTVWIVADLPEYQLGAVKVGAAAKIRVRSLPGQTFSGRVALIYPQVTKETRTSRVRIEIPNPDGLLLPDMYADVELGSGSNAPVVAVPDSAVIDTGTLQVVILDKGEAGSSRERSRLAFKAEALPKSATALARSRVLEYLNAAAQRLPAGVMPGLVPMRLVSVGSTNTPSSPRI